MKIHYSFTVFQSGWYVYKDWQAVAGGVLYVSGVIGLINGQILTLTWFAKYFGSNSNGNVKQLPSTNVTISPTSDVVVVTIIIFLQKIVH